MKEFSIFQHTCNVRESSHLRESLGGEIFIALSTLCPKGGTCSREHNRQCQSLLYTNYCVGMCNPLQKTFEGELWWTGAGKMDLPDMQTVNYGVKQGEDLRIL